MATGASSVAPATYEVIQTWIGQQRRSPEPLTDRLRTALLNLEYAVKAEAPALSEPELGEMNWIGLLQEYRDVHPIGAREDTFSITWFDPTGRGPLRWMCQVTLAEDPRPSFPDETRPSFARKKDAKKYAAKCAIEWLQAKGYMPKNGVKFPKGTTNVLMVRPPLPPPNNNQQNMPPNTNTNSSFTSSDENQPPATQKVSQLCVSLGIRPPTYKLESPNNDNIYTGRVDFGDDNGILPFDVTRLCVVGNVQGQKLAREMLAEDLLSHLVAEKAKRDAEFRFMSMQSNDNMR
ncbi:hypothetical protein F4861DRAFT_519291 [Xylaria intraflava]|nr:hypothetical protein F4861DRAFT_519291 [Xylaria intraflava]